MEQLDVIKRESSFSKDFCLEVWEKLFFARALDQKMHSWVRQNKGTTFFLSTEGHELIGTLGGMFFSSKKDWCFPYYRDRAFALSLGVPPEDLFAAFLARDIPHHSGGRMMLDHFSDKTFRIPCQSSCVGSQYLQATGKALAISLQGKDEVVYVSGGDGSTSQGDFHEALNFSCIHRLPIVFVVQDNGWAISVSSKEQTAGESIVPIARGFSGLSVFSVDGCDLWQLSTAFQEAIQKARSKRGPSLIVAKVSRLGPHTFGDDPLKYKDEKTLLEEKKKDPLVLHEFFLSKEYGISPESLSNKREEIRKRIDSMALEVEKIPFPKRETATDHVFKETKVLLSEEKKIIGPKIAMVEALNHALEEEMKRDERVLVFGEDVAGGKGGVFGVTKTLTQKFGKRCFNTPLAESTIVGLAIGLSLGEDFLPVAEIQFSDYSWSGINQLVNELASIYYRSNGEWNCPVVVRMSHGGYVQGGPYHSQSLEAIFCHTPGLKVVIPSHAADAKRLLKTAIRDPNPVIFLEHKNLYRQQWAFREEPSSEDFLPFGVANVVSEGTEVTVLCWGMMVLFASECAQELKKENFSVEVIDLRTLNPLDLDTILKSVRKTGKVLIVHEAPKTCGFGSELAALLAEKAFSFLDAPICRVTGKDCPIPYCKDLEEAILPQKEDLYQALKKLLLF